MFDELQITFGNFLCSIGFHKWKETGYGFSGILDQCQREHCGIGRVFSPRGGYEFYLTKEQVEKAMVSDGDSR